MAWITQECIEAVRQANDIVDVIGEYARLVGRDPAFKCCCPFHDDKTPSLSVRRDRQFFYCFGCGTKGDIFAFVQKIENQDFSGAVEHLARRAGVPVVYQQGGPPAGRDPNLLELLEWATQQLQRALRAAPADHPARVTLKQRGIDNDEIERYRIGLDPDWQLLVGAARMHGYSEEMLETAGVAARSETTGRLYDRFHHRLIFPIADLTGRVVGFGGRRLADDDSAKYINSPDSPLFQKSRLLYGAHLARADVGDTRRAVICEGYTDVIALHRAGVGEAMAPMGTALNAEHLRVLRRLPGLERVIVLFDGDAPGVARACAAVRALIASEFPIYVGLLPDQLDPDDMLRAGRADELRACIDAAADGVEFVIDQLLAARRPATHHERKAALAELAPLMAMLPSPAVQAGYTSLLAQKLELERRVVEEELHKLTSAAKRRPLRRTADQTTEHTARAAVSAQDRLWQKLIGVLLYAHEAVGVQTPEAFWASPQGSRMLELLAPIVDGESQAPYERCLAMLYWRRREDAPIDAAALAAAHRELNDVLAESAVASADLPAQPDKLERFTTQLVQRLLAPRWDEQRAQLRMQVQAAGSPQLMRDYLALAARRRER